MTLRLAQESDYGEVIRMARNFHLASPYSELEFDEPSCRRLFEAYLSNKREFMIILAEKEYPFGMIVGHCASSPFSKDKITSELAWWVDEEYRGSRDSLLLMKAYEDWCVRVGSKITQMAMLDQSTDLEKFYRKSGYIPAERSFIKWQSSLL